MEVLQARILEWVAMPFSRGSSQCRDWTQVSHIAGRFFSSWAAWEAHSDSYHYEQRHKEYLCPSVVPRLFNYLLRVTFRSVFNEFKATLVEFWHVWLGFRKNSISPSFFMTLQEGSRLMPLSSSSTVWENSFFLPHSSRGDKVVVAPNFANTSKTPTLKTSHHLEATCSAKSNFLSYRIRIEQWGSVLRVQSNCTVLDRTQRACSV